MTIDEAKKIIDAANAEPSGLRAFDVAVARILRDANVSDKFREALKDAYDSRPDTDPR